MAKKRTGPEGPDHLTEPDEIAPSDTAPLHDNPGRDPMQRSTHEALGGASGSTPGGVPLGKVVYDSGWEDHSGVALRVVFTAGPANGLLRDWVRDLALRPRPLDGGGSEEDR